MELSWEENLYPYRSSMRLLDLFGLCLQLLHLPCLWANIATSFYCRRMFLGKIFSIGAPSSCDFVDNELSLVVAL